MPRPRPDYKCAAKERQSEMMKRSPRDSEMRAVECFEYDWEDGSRRRSRPICADADDTPASIAASSQRDSRHIWDTM